MRREWNRPHGHRIVTPLDVLIWSAAAMQWSIYRRSAPHRRIGTVDAGAPIA